MRPNEVTRTAQKSAASGSQKGGRAKGAAIKVGRDSGRVKVFVRVRPLKPQEISRKEQVAVDVSELNSSIHMSDPKHSYEKDFPFDHVFPSESTNHEVCNTICKPIVSSALNGFNGTLMAYGQTGSGKTYTLMAPDGIAAGVVDRCFKRIMQDSKHDYKVSMSYLQIYQEKIYDLLNSTNKVELSIREHPLKGVYVENLSEFVVRTPSEIMNLLAVGKKRLVFAETKMNRTSSRSHSVCMLLIERTLSKDEGSKPKDCVPNCLEKKSPTKESRANSLSRRTSSPKKTLASSSSNPDLCPSETEEEEQDSLAKMTFTDDVLVRGRIHLCDLAGSERLKKTQAEGERLSEAQHINLSLLELGNVIHALADGSKTHVPFRNSTLTRLLQESLGGNCKTSLIVCVSPTMTDVSETKSTLLFGSRAMKITNTAYVNVEVDYKKLSDDLTKMLNSREKDMDDLKLAFENRMEKVKMEAESQINSSMAAAQEALCSARNLYETKEQELKVELQQVDNELQREKHLSIELREQLSSLGGFLQGGVHRAKTALLSELLSMQLFYALQDLPEEKRQDIVNTLQKDHLNTGDRLLEAREKVLENTDNVLQLFESYLKLLQRSGKDLENTDLNLKDCETGKPLESDAASSSTALNSEAQEIDSAVPLDIEAVKDIDSVNLESLTESTILGCDDLVPDCVQLALNKTDDDKVVESGMIELKSTESKVLTQTKHLRGKLNVIKDSLDDDALCFLKKAFAIDEAVKDSDRKQVYAAMMEVLKQRENKEGEQSRGTQDVLSISMVEAEMALLEQSLCHVLIDKALQNSLLLLERTETRRHCEQLTESNNTLNKELEVMRLQVETLVSENTKLNSKLSETSNFLQDVKSSKELLENDLSSVFQLYNMRSQEKKFSKGIHDNNGNHGSSQDLKDGISSLVEENAKLKVELKDTQKEKIDLQIQLKNTKEELEKLTRDLEFKSSISLTSQSTQIDISSLSKETQTAHDQNGAFDASDQDSSLEKLSNGESIDDIEDEDIQRKKSVSKKLVDIEQFLLKLQDELVKLEDDELGLFSHSKQKQAVSSLRLNLNKRLGELWSLEVVESKKLRARVDELTTKLDNSTNDYEQQIEDLEKELCVESEARLNLENELLQYRKEVMDLGAEIWTTRLKEDSASSDTSNDLVINVGQRDSLSPPDEVDGTRRLSVNLYSISRCNSDDSLHENSRQRAELYIAEIDNKKAKEELQDLKQSFVQLNQDLAESGKERQEMEEKYVNLTNETKAITLKFKANEDKNRALEEKLIHVSAMKTTLQEELLKLKDKERSHHDEIRSYKEKIANYEVEKTKLKQDLSKTEIRYTTIDNKYQEINKEFMETTKRLKDAQTKLKAREQELTDLHEAYDRLRSNILHDDSDRESLVEVKMKPNGRRDTATPSRIQSIHLVSRAKVQSKKKQPTYPTAKKKMSMKRSPRNDELTRSNTIKRTGTIGKRGTLNSPRDSRTLTRRDSDRDTLKRGKGRTLKRDSEEDQKLKSELLLAKEQLIRLKGELTLSNIQTANLGTHLSSLREDSNKLEVELTSLRRSPGAAKEDEHMRSSKADKLLETELDKAKEKIIKLQDEMLSLRKEKSSNEEKAEEPEKEVTQLRSELYKTRDGLERSQEVVKILNKEIELLETKYQMALQRLTSYTDEELQKLVDGKDGSAAAYKLTQYEQDKARLEKEIEQLNNEKTKLEDMQSLVQQLVEVEDEQALLKRRLRNAVKQGTKSDETDDNGANAHETEVKSSQKKKSPQRLVKELQQNAENKLEEYYVENTALRCEVDALRIYIANLENENKSVKYKLSISESMHGNKDKKVLATLLASAKHEREELRETLNNVYSEKEDIEEALNVARIKTERLQRELHVVVFNRDELEKELNSIKTSVNTPEKESTSPSLTMDEKGVVELVRGFLCTIGSRNAKDVDIKEFVKTILATKIQLTTKSGKSIIDQRNPSWNRSSSMTRNGIKGDSPVKTNKTQATVYRSGVNSNTSPTKTSRTAGLRRSKPGTDRGTPEGMEEERQATSKSIKTKHTPNTKSISSPKSHSIETASSDKPDKKSQNRGHAKTDNSVDFSTADKLYNQLQSASKEIKDDLSLIYMDLDHNSTDNHTDEVLIKRAWSLKDLFKRSTSNSKAATSPSYINQ